VAVILYATVGRMLAQRPTLRELELVPPRRQRLWAMLKQGAHTQYVVTLGLVPWTMLLFAQVSLVSPLANALAIPLISLVARRCRCSAACCRRHCPAFCSDLRMNWSGCWRKCCCRWAVTNSRSGARLRRRGGSLGGPVRHLVDAGLARLAVLGRGDGSQCPRRPVAHGVKLPAPPDAFSAISLKMTDLVTCALAFFSLSLDIAIPGN
jgi:hypothetical protein